MRLILALLLLAGCPQPRSGGGGSLTCGPGTFEEDGVCVPEDGVPECGEGTIRIADACVAAEIQWAGFPLAEGEGATLGQTFHGNFSHQDSSRYAVDVPLSEGTPLAAMRGGTVVQVKEDSDTGCGDSSCADDGNFVRIDHGDGTFGLYFHLEQNGAQVSEGDGICAGEILGFSGNTGFSTGPHLHAAIENVFGLSLPLRFHELEEANGGVPAPGMQVVSTNAEDTDCAPPEPSECPEDQWAHQGVRLDPGVPCSLVERDVTYPVSGSISHGESVFIGTWRADPVNGGFAWSYQCATADPAGRFESNVQWPSESVGDASWLVFGAGDANCSSFGGWAYSARITFAD